MITFVQGNILTADEEAIVNRLSKSTKSTTWN